MLKIIRNEEAHDLGVKKEKSAIIASCIVPDIIWLAAGDLNGLSNYFNLTM